MEIVYVLRNIFTVSQQIQKTVNEIGMWYDAYVTFGTLGIHKLVFIVSVKKNHTLGRTISDMNFN